MRNNAGTGVVWNVLGGMINAATSVLLFLLVTRLCGTEQAGMFSVVFATAQMLMEIGCHGVRGYQASDIEEKYSFKEYEINRFISCAAMLLGILLMNIVKGYTGRIASLMICIGIFKLIDALADVYEGYLQQHHNLTACGKSLFLRTFFSILAFGICLFITNNLFVASFIMAVVSVIFFLCLAYIPTKKKLDKVQRIDKIYIIGIFKESFPLFISLLLLAYVANIPKFAIEERMTYEAQTYYNIIFLPAQVIYLVVIYVFKPFITNLTQIYHDNWKKFKKYVNGLIVLVMIMSGIAICVADFIGIPLLQLLYGIELEDYKTELLVIMVGGGFNALAGLMYYFLTIIRKQSVSMIAYIVGTVGALLCSDMLVDKWKILGATICYDVSTGIIIFIMLVVVVCHKEERE